MTYSKAGTFQLDENSGKSIRRHGAGNGGRSTKGPRGCTVFLATFQSVHVV